ncbi:MAG: FAD-dependent oxidoreductase, partial [Verrucomicrobia bacterium]|nr:FAD-dependent oxidoreductase [Verrucomicrobiota bacterium]
MGWIQSGTHPEVDLGAGTLAPLWQEGVVKIAVIGAGISGLVCARRLVEAGHGVVVFEKSRNLGGRCATRKFGEHVVDHGVQYFTLRDPQILKEVEVLAGERLQTLCNPILLAGQDGEIYREGEQRFYLADGNHRVGTLLAQGLDVRREIEIKAVEKSGRKWR